MIKCFRVISIIQKLQLLFPNELSTRLQKRRIHITTKVFRGVIKNESDIVVLNNRGKLFSFETQHKNIMLATFDNLQEMPGQYKFFQ